MVRCWEASGSGAGLPVLVIHGISARSTHFVPTGLRLLRTSRRVLLLDLPGHGASDMPAPLSPATLEDGTRQAMDVLLDERMVVFGNSLGGLAAIKTALQFPDRVAGLCLCSPGGAPMDPQTLDRFLDNFRFTERGPAAAFVNRCLAAPAWYAPVAAGATIDDFARIGSLLSTISSQDLLTEDDLSQLACSIHLQWGDGDALMPIEHRAWFREHLPEHTFEAPAGFGHCPNLDRPGLLARSIAAFVDRVTASSA